MTIASQAEQLSVDRATGIKTIFLQIQLEPHHRLTGYSQVTMVLDKALEEPDIREITPYRLIARLVHRPAILDKRIDAFEKSCGGNCFYSHDTSSFMLILSKTAACSSADTWI